MFELHSKAPRAEKSIALKNRGKLASAHGSKKNVPYNVLASVPATTLTVVVVSQVNCPLLQKEHSQCERKQFSLIY